MDLLFQYLPTLFFACLASIAAYAISGRPFELIQQMVPRLAGLRKYLRENNSQLIDRSALIITLVALIGFTAQTLHNYDSFGSYPDMRYADNVLYNVLQNGEITIYLYRFDLILLALAPLYVLWHDPRILLMLQAMGLAISALPLYWSARCLINRPLALCVALAYLYHPSLQALNLPLFAEIKLAIPLLSFATFFLLRKSYRAFLICLGVCLLVKQEVALTAAGFAFFILVVQRNRALGLALGTTGLGLAVAFVQFIYPALTGRPYPHFAGGRFSYLGDSIGQALLTLVQNPKLALTEVWTREKMDFVLSLMTPLAGLPLLGIEIFLISFPAWAYTLLSREANQFNPNQYYQAPLIPFLFFGTVIGLKRLSDWKPGNPRWQIALAVLLLSATQLYLPSNWTRILDVSSFALTPHDVLGHRLLTLVPENTTAVAQTEFFMAFSSPHQNYVLEFSPHEDYSGDSDSVLEVKGDVYLFGDSTRTYYKLHQSTWEYWRASGYFETIAEEDGYVLLKRKMLAQQRTTLENGLVLIGSPDTRFQVDDKWGLLGYADQPNSFLNHLNLTFENKLTLLGFALVPKDNVEGGNTIHAVVEWRANQDIHDPYVVIAQLVDAGGHVWAQDNREPVYGLVPTQRWKAGDLIRDQYTFVLPVEMPPGTYSVRLSIWDEKGGKSLEAQDEAQRPLGLEVTLGPVAVKKNTNSILGSYLPIERPLSIDLREIRLLGSTAIPETVGAGEELPVGLYWRARGKPEGDYLVSVLMRDPSGRTVLEQSSRPAMGAYPTPLWQIGEILLDWHDLALPASLASGDYTLTVVLRNATHQSDIGEANLTVIHVIGQ